MPHITKDRLGRLLVPLLALAAACAETRPERIVWPFPPEVARIEYVRTIATSADVATPWGRFWNAISGEKGVTLQNPTALALSPDGKRLYASCTAFGKVLFFDLPQGRSGRAADDEGHRPVNPFGLAVDGSGNLYVSDEIKRTVWVYSPEGKFVREIGKDMFDRPAGIAFDRKRQLLYVVDGSNGGSSRHRVEVFAPDGRHLRTIGTRGSRPGEFNFPSFVTVAPDGRVFVADTLNFRIQVFDPEGNLLTTLGEIGEGPGRFAKVKGMAFDSFGDLYVVDGQAGIVQMFSPGLRPLMAFGGVAARRELMHNPTDIVIDSKNDIYVSDYGYNQVNQYALVNTSARDVEAADAPAKKSENGSQDGPGVPASPPPPTAAPR